AAALRPNGRAGLGDAPQPSGSRAAVGRMGAGRALRRGGAARRAARAGRLPPQPPRRQRGGATLCGAAAVRRSASPGAQPLLARLRLVMLTVTVLAPLAGLPRLADVELVGLQRVPDLAPLGTLPSLRRLVVARAGGEYRDIVHVDSLRPLAAAQALEEVVLTGTVVDDGDLAPLAELPALRRVVAFGEVSDAVAAL